MIQEELSTLQLKHARQYWVGEGLPNRLINTLVGNGLDTWTAVRNLGRKGVREIPGMGEAQVSILQWVMIHRTGLDWDGSRVRPPIVARDLAASTVEELQEELGRRGYNIAQPDPRLTRDLTSFRSEELEEELRNRGLSTYVRIEVVGNEILSSEDKDALRSKLQRLINASRTELSGPFRSID